MKRAVIFIVEVLVFTFAFGCTYTAPSVASPDLVERIASGHTICYYRTGPDRGYAKCCPDCPMHGQSVTEGGVK